MLAKVEKLTAAMQKSLIIVGLDSPSSRQAHFCTKRPAKPIKTFPVHEKVQAIYDNWVTPEKIFTAPKIFAELSPVEKELIKKLSVPVVDPIVLVLNKHLTVETEDVPLLRDPAKDNQGNPEFQDLALLKQLQQLPSAMLFCVNTLEKAKFTEWL